MPKRRFCSECGRRCQGRMCADCRGWGGPRPHAAGYRRVWCPGHPMAGKDGYALEHRKVLHDAGIEVPPDAHVHHLNGIKDDNRLSNLRVMEPEDHHREHLSVGARVINQYGTWQVLTPEERRERQRQRNRARREKERAR